MDMALESLRWLNNVTQSKNILNKATCAYASYATLLALSKNSSTREDLKRVIPIQRFI
jgi:hypothetical protein